MKHITALLLSFMLLFTLAACTPAPGENSADAPILVLNGEVLDVYTMHYDVREEYAVVPLEAFLHSIGADYAESSFNKYGIQCYSFMGKRYIMVCFTQKMSSSQYI